jgi:hypothetical protein
VRFALGIFFLLFFSSACVMADEFRDVKTFELKKDEVKKILIKYDDRVKLFKFRWTLYKNNGLVIHRSYDKIVAQNILYLRNRNRTFRVQLKPRKSKYHNVPYLLVKFKEFDFKTKKAVFEIFLSDKSMDIKVKYLKNS